MTVVVLRFTKILETKNNKQRASLDELKSLKIEWKDFALGFFIGVTICLYAYISNTGDVQATLTKPSATITGFVAA